MKLTVVTDPIHYIYIEDFYTEEELNLIWLELECYLSIPERLLPPEETGSATDEDGNIRKENRGVWLDNVYTQDYRHMSNILNVNQKLFRPEIINQQSSWFFKDAHLNTDGTLISYYEDCGYYLKHNDVSYMTACTWFFKEPKKFTGGDFHFCDYDITVECKNNSTVIFPSNLYHSVDTVSIPHEHRNKGYGRFCMTQFVKIV
jgi:predicted 2-oxoglutarate/Fe(II)-dependent dioxygenase YbiX